ncbi:MAG: NUDIX hydrolase [Bacillota bacterium]
MKRVNVAYVILLRENKEKILVVKNTGKKGSYYTLPGGAVEPGEILEDAARREALEETGLIVEPKGLAGVTEAFFEERGHHAVFFYFHAEVKGGDIAISCPDEIEEVVWMDIVRAKKYIGIPSISGSVPYSFQGIK